MFVKTHHFHNRHRYHTIASTANDRVASQQCNHSTNQHLKNKVAASSHQLINSSPISEVHHHNNHQYHSQQQQQQTQSTAYKQQQAPHSSSQKHQTEQQRYQHHSSAAQGFRQQQQHSLPAQNSCPKQISKAKKLSKSDAYLSPILRSNRLPAAPANHRREETNKAAPVTLDHHNRDNSDNNKLRTALTDDNGLSNSAHTIRGVTSDSDIGNQRHYLCTKLHRSLSFDSYILSIKHDRKRLVHELQTGCCCALDATTYALKRQHRYSSENNKQHSNNRKWYRLCEQCYIKHIDHFVVSNSNHKSNNKSRQRLVYNANERQSFDHDRTEDERQFDSGSGADFRLNNPKKLLRSTSLTIDNRLIDRNSREHWSAKESYLIERTLSNSHNKSRILHSITSGNLSACKLLLELSGKLFKNLWILDLRNIHLFGLFCENFITYQVETLYSSFVSLRKRTTGANRRATNTAARSRDHCCRQLKRQNSQMSDSSIESISSEFDKTSQQPMQQQQHQRTQQRPYSSTDYCRDGEGRNDGIDALEASLSSHSLNDDQFTSNAGARNILSTTGGENNHFCYANYGYRPGASWAGADTSRPQTSASGVVFGCGGRLMRCNSHEDYLLTGSLIDTKQVDYGPSTSELSSMHVRNRAVDLIDEDDANADGDEDKEDKYSDTGAPSMRTRLLHQGCSLPSGPIIGRCFAAAQPGDQCPGCSQSARQCDFCVDVPVSPSSDWPREPIAPLMSPQGTPGHTHSQEQPSHRRPMSTAHRYSVAVTHSPTLPPFQTIDRLDPWGSSLDESRYVRVVQSQQQPYSIAHLQQQQHRHNHHHHHHHHHHQHRHRHHPRQSNQTHHPVAGSLTSVARSDTEPCRRVPADHSQPIAVQKGMRHDQSTLSGNIDNSNNNNNDNSLPSFSPQSVSSGLLISQKQRWQKSAASIDNYPHFARTGASARVGFIESGRSISAASSDLTKGVSAGGAPKDATNPQSMASSVGSRNSNYFGSVEDVIKFRSMSQSGAKRRLGFKQKFSGDSNKVLNVNRSEEIVPSDEMLAELANRPMTWTESFTISERTGQFSESFDSSIGSQSVFVRQSTRIESSDGDHPNSCRTKVALQDPRTSFVNGLGVGQMASRQALVAPYLGDIQLGICDQRGMLEVEIVRARHLQAKPEARRLPSPYVKVYLMRDKKCIAKFKTAQMRHTLDPVFKQLFIFRDSYKDCVLQTIVWGDYGKRDRKTLMGVVQIHLNDLDTRSDNRIFGWYRLFNAPSMATITSTPASTATSTAANSLASSVVHETKSLDAGTDQQQQQAPDDKNRSRESCKRMRQLAYKQQQRSILSMMLSTTLIGAAGCSSKQLRQTISASRLCSISIGPTEESDSNNNSNSNNNQTNEPNRNHHHETSSLTMKPDRYDTNTNYTDTTSNQSSNILPVKQQQQRPMTDHH